MTRTYETDVLIVGAGPVGLTLAIELASRGVDVLVAEMRHRGEPPSVKCNHVSARSMEIFRRLGVAERIRNAGLPPDYPHDVSYRTTTTGIEMSRIEIPSRNGRLRGEEGPDTWWPTPEPPHRINQIYLEPILFDHAEGLDRVTILNRTEIIGFAQDDDGVQAQGRGLDDGEEIVVNSAYLVGCEGGRSATRKAIGAELRGDAVIQRVQSTYFRAPSLMASLNAPPAWGMFTMNPRRSGMVYTIDGHETFLLHNYLLPDEPDFESVDRDRCIRQILGVDDAFAYEVLSKEDWFGRRLVADRFRDRRAFICGDAAHIWVPFAGYGMNAGIADANNLAWMLAAVLQGWAAPAILGAHEIERQPITEQVSHYVMNHALALARQRLNLPDNLEAAGADGEAARAAVGRAAYDLNVQQYCCAGLNFGYFYENSPIVAYDGETAPGYAMASFTESTVPGCRTPHFWLGEGRSLYDALGPDYTLLRFDRDIDVSAILKAVQAKGVPLGVLDVDPAVAPPAYGTKLVLSRPDRHVAWCGDAVPADAAGLVDLIRGASSGANRPWGGGQ